MHVCGNWHKVTKSPGKDRFNLSSWARDSCCRCPPPRRLSGTWSRGRRMGSWGPAPPSARPRGSWWPPPAAPSTPWPAPSAWGRHRRSWGPQAPPRSHPRTPGGQTSHQGPRSQAAAPVSSGNCLRHHPLASPQMRPQGVGEWFLKQARPTLDAWWLCFLILALKIAKRSKLWDLNISMQN